MSNLIAIGTHCQRGDEVICGNKSHIFTYEGAGASGECPSPSVRRQILLMRRGADLYFR